MKKVFAFVAVVAALSFTSCGGNKSAESTEAVAETETVVEETVIEQDSTQVEDVAAADSTVQETTPAAK